MEDIERIERSERYILVAAAPDEEKAWASLDELSDLLDTAGGETVCHVVQRL